MDKRLLDKLEDVEAEAALSQEMADYNAAQAGEAMATLRRAEFNLAAAEQKYSEAKCMHETYVRWVEKNLMRTGNIQNDQCTAREAHEHLGDDQTCRDDVHLHVAIKSQTEDMEELFVIVQKMEERQGVLEERLQGVEAEAALSDEVADFNATQAGEAMATVHRMESRLASMERDHEESEARNAENGVYFAASERVRILVSEQHLANRFSESQQEVQRLQQSNEMLHSELRSLQVRFQQEMGELKDISHGHQTAANSTIRQQRMEIQKLQQESARLKDMSNGHRASADNTIRQQQMEIQEMQQESARLKDVSNGHRVSADNTIRQHQMEIQELQQESAQLGQQMNTMFISSAHPTAAASNTIDQLRMEMQEQQQESAKLRQQVNTLWASLRRASEQNEQLEVLSSMSNVRDAASEGYHVESRHANTTVSQRREKAVPIQPYISRAVTAPNLILSPKNPWRSI
eukprot:gnl/MRDRNA2_/MRDRNA2_126045_c0_seq1.p1 gnl/MRDRNA2_/MRDRNA2_126045_c0~~gnl/MRDRNA2_/MRDRNA2_126045_c0_seq1.p1  ORF type:complete len:462 (+),score=135.23 gnl/MRDRNA2_/MRDRNA2_126045_c0_seq1:152-1537(+)